MANSLCRYVPSYSGPCGAPAVNGFCEKHADQKCSSCGGQATHGCNYTGQFVCGYPLCDHCEGWEDRSKASGSWGFLNHSHRMKESHPKFDPPIPPSLVESEEWEDTP